MKQIFLNLKRFDIPSALGGVNSIAPIGDWGVYIIRSVQDALPNDSQAQYTIFFPEAHLIPALQALHVNSPIRLGCQGVYREDTDCGNFGAFTTNRPASAMNALGVQCALIGHCEERQDKAGILLEAGVRDSLAVNRLLNREIKAATRAGLSVLYCVGETEQEKPDWQTILMEQLEIGLDGVDTVNVTVAYEPVWAVGPRKTPPGPDYITKVASFLKKAAGELQVVYGGGLKPDNARMLAGIPEIDGGLIALTHFSGEIKFYPDEYIETVRLYLKGDSHETGF